MDAKSNSLRRLAQRIWVRRNELHDCSAILGKLGRRRLWVGLVLCSLLTSLSCSSGGLPGCGSNTIESGEVCDGTALAGKSCAALGALGGALACKSDCSGYDTTSCQALATCGNAVLDEREVCDGALLNGHTCQREGFGGGNLKCQSNCLGLDTTGCSGVCAPVCTGRVCGPDPVCGKDCGSCPGVHDACGTNGQCVLSCDLETIASDQTLNLDANIVTVTGTLTVGGTVLPGGARPTLLFANQSSGAIRVVQLPAAGAATYSIKLWKGVYDVTLRDDFGNGVVGVGQGLESRLESDVSLLASSVKNYDVAVVTVTGTITANGSVLPEGARPMLRFQNKSSSGIKVRQLPANGNANYTVKLWQGVYDVAVQDDAGNGVLGVGQGLVAELADGVSLLGDAVKNYDLGVVTVTGTITVGGSDLPTGARPALSFQNKSSGTTKLRQLPTNGKASYTAKLWKGAYDIAVQDDAGNGVLGVGQSLVARLDSGVGLVADTTKSYDLGVVTITGTVTVGGAALPSGSRPALLFRNKSSGTVKSRQLTTAGAATYTVKLWKGDYDVTAQDDAGNGVLGIGQSLSSKLEKGVSVLTDTVKNYDLGVVTITGVVTVNGSVLPNGARPMLLFQNRSTGTTKSRQLPTTGAASYTVKLWKGDYDVTVQDDAGNGVLGIGQSLSAKLASGVSLLTDSVKNHDLKVVTVSGTFTVDGGTLPSGARPALLFQNLGSGATFMRQLPSNGAAPYSVKLWQGAYDVTVQDDAGNGVLGIGQSLAAKLVRGCPESSGGTGACTSGNGTWHFFPQRAGFDSVELAVTVSGTVLSGTWDSPSGYSGTFTGTKTGGHFVIDFDFGGCQWKLDGTATDCDLHSTLTLSCNSPTVTNGYIEP